MKFKVILEKDEDGIYCVYAPSLPGCISQGKTEKEAMGNIKEAIGLHLKCLAKEGIPLVSKNSREALVSVNL